MKKYSELTQLKTFKERYDYLRMRSRIGESTFGSDRLMNQLLYTSSLWKRTRDHIIIRDSGFDMAMDGYVIFDSPVIHHINPITMEDIQENAPKLYDPQNLICVSSDTHSAIHFGRELREIKVITRTRNDTSPWLNNKREDDCNELQQSSYIERSSEKRRKRKYCW